MWSVWNLREIKTFPAMVPAFSDLCVRPIGAHNSWSRRFPNAVVAISLRLDEELLYRGNEFIC